MSKNVCVLADWEVHDFVENNGLPDCRKHQHVKLSEAIEMVAGRGFYQKACAGWVGQGQRQIQMLARYDWKPAKTWFGHVVYNRIRN